MRNKKRILRTSGTARMPFAPRRAAVPAFASLGRMMDGRMRATGRPALPDTRQHHEEAASVLCGKHSSTLRQVLEYFAASTIHFSARHRSAVRPAAPVCQESPHGGCHGSPPRRDACRTPLPAGREAAPTKGHGTKRKAAGRTQAPADFVKVSLKRVGR